MLKHLTIASILASVAISADADTFQFQFSGGGATATGSFTTSDTAAGTLAGVFIAEFANVSALNVTVAGASSGNGTFALTDFNRWLFRSTGALNFTQNLVGQENFNSFTLFGIGSPRPTATFYFEMTSDAGTGTAMDLACFFLQGVGTCGTPVSVRFAAFAPFSNFRTRGAAQTLDSLNGGSGEMANLLTILSAMTPAQQAAVLERLAPITSRAVQLSLRNNMLMSFDRLSARMDAVNGQQN